MMRCLRPFATLFLLLLAPRADAHALRLGHLELHRQGADVVTLLWRAPDGLPAPRVVLGEGCRVVEETRSEFVQQRLECPQAATARRLKLERLPSDLPVVLVLGAGTESGRARWLADAGAREVPWVGAPSAWAEAFDYLCAGAGHVLGGADHLLFLVALFVWCRSARELASATLLFTLGHASSLAAVASGRLNLVPRFAELGIALTLVVAARAIAMRQAAGSGSGSRVRSPSGTAAIFGCVHGLGFAGALEEVGLQAAGSLRAIASFNLGVELGQLAFVAVLACAVGMLGRAARIAVVPWPRLASLLVGGAGIFWCLERISPA